MGTTRCYYHCLGLSLHGIERHITELIDDDLRLFPDGTVMHFEIALHSSGSWRFLITWIL